jgi:Lrp/AsnC family transcriptional regulator for asnA, asnC and gidA
MSIDRLDLRIIRSLNKDARKPYKKIAEELDVSDATIRKRIKKMVQQGIIKQFIVLIDYEKIGRVVKAFINLKINPHKLTEIVASLENNPDVQVLYRTTGSGDLFIELIVKDMKELNWFLENKLSMEGIVSQEVNIVIGAYKRCPCTGI